MQAPLQNPNRAARHLFTPLPARYDRLEAALSLGQNDRWRREMVTHVAAEHPATTLDVATGTAGVAIEIARRTDADVTGVDLTPAMLRQGQDAIASANLTARCRLVAAQAEALPFPDATFDALTFTYLLRYVADPAATLRELVRVIRPGAPIASLEFYVPPNIVWHGAWWAYTRAALPLLGYAGGGRPWFDVGRFLGPNISAHYRRWPLAKTLDAWKAAGCEDVTAKVMSLGGGVVVWGRKTA